MNNDVFSVGACPAKYQDKLFLTPTDIIDYLQSAPFRVEKVGKLIYVNAKSFWSWYGAN